jgi:hypothetical protein
VETTAVHFIHVNFGGDNYKRKKRFPQWHWHNWYYFWSVINIAEIVTQSVIDSAEISKSLRVSILF